MFKEKQPQIKDIFVKSDNARCYHNGQNPEALYLLFKKYSLLLKRCDFNEPSQGKDPLLEQRQYNCKIFYLKLCQ